MGGARLHQLAPDCSSKVTQIGRKLLLVLLKIEVHVQADGCFHLRGVEGRGGGQRKQAAPGPVLCLRAWSITFSLLGSFSTTAGLLYARYFLNSVIQAAMLSSNTSARAR